MIRGLNKIIEFTGLGYVMSSYTVHEGGLDEAHREASIIGGVLLRAGLVVFVPIAYGPVVEPHIAESASDEKYVKTHEFWMTLDERFYSRSDYGILAMTSNWWKSEGIAAEVYALSRSEKSIYFFDIDDLHIYTYAEARKKWPEKVRDLEALAAEGKHTASLHEITERYSKSVKEYIDSLALSKLFKSPDFKDLSAEFRRNLTEGETPSVN